MYAYHVFAFYLAPEMTECFGFVIAFSGYAFARIVSLEDIALGDVSVIPQRQESCSPPLHQERSFTTICKLAASPQ